MPDSSVASDQGPTVKSRRPAESAFKQQRLPAWQPILTAGTVLPTFFVIGIAFIPVGIGLLYFSDEVKEHIVDYTFCDMKGGQTTCADYIKQNNMTDKKCYCEMQLNLTEDFKAEVYFYYGLSNYYQNHRRYVKSRDDNQLLGKLTLPLSSDCDPFSEAHDENGVKRPVAPCGAIANSLFNDSLSLYSQEQQVLVPVLRTGLAWNSDKQIKFRNPDTSGGSLKAAFANYTKPANWAKHVWELDLENPDNNGFQNEDLIVWMRTAALPTFRKLYRRVNHDQDGFRTGLNKGLYTVKIEYNYPVTDFDGTKSFIISTTSLLGGKNPFLGVAYVVVGTLCLLLGIILLIIHVRCSKKYYPTPTESFFLDIDTYHRKYDEDVSLVTNQKRSGGRTVSLVKPDEPLASAISLKSPKATLQTKSIFDPSTSKTVVRSNLENSEAQTKKESAENKEPPVSLKSSAATLVASSPGKEPMLERAGAATDVLTPAPETVKADAATGVGQPDQDKPKAAVTPSQVQTEHKATQSNPFGLIEDSKATRAPSDVTVPKPKQDTFGLIEESKPTRAPSDVTVPKPKQDTFGLIEGSKPTRAPSDVTVAKPKQDTFGLIEESKPTRAPSDVTVPKPKQATFDGIEESKPTRAPSDVTVPKPKQATFGGIEESKPTRAPSDVTVPKPKQATFGLIDESKPTRAPSDVTVPKPKRATFGLIEELKPTRAPSDVTVPKSNQAEVLQTDAIVPKVITPAPETVKADAAPSVDQSDQDKPKEVVTSSQGQTKHDQDTSKAAQSNPFGGIEESKPTRAPSDVTVPKSNQAEVLQTDAIVPKVITPAPETVKADAAPSVDQSDQDKPKEVVTSSQGQTKHDQDTSKAAQSNPFGGIEESKPTRAPSDVTVPKSNQAEVLQTDAIVPKAQSTAPDAAQEAVKDDQIKKQDQNATAPAQKSPETAPDKPTTSKELDEKTENKKEKKD